MDEESLAQKTEFERMEGAEAFGRRVRSERQIAKNGVHRHSLEL
jgi:hypothetical protein